MRAGIRAELLVIHTGCKDLAAKGGDMKGLCGLFRVRNIWVAVISAIVFASWIGQPAPARAETLTLFDALTQAMAADPSLAAASARVNAAAAGIRQAARRRNPSIGLELEDFGGSGNVSGFDQAQTTLYVEQLLERGGKREARVGVAQSQTDANYFRREARALDLFKSVEDAWIEALVAAAKVNLAEEQLANATRFKADIDRRVKAARDPSFAEARANTQVSQARIAVEQALRNAHTARATLASYWNGFPDFDLPLNALANLNHIDDAGASIVDADLNVLEAEQRTATARVGLQVARSYQDPTVKLGIRHLGDGDDVAVVAGFSIPLAVHDANQDNIARAYAEQTAASLDVEALQKVRDREVGQLRARLITLAQEVERTGADVIPEAERAVRLVLEGFNAGSFSYIDVIEAQRALTEARAQRIEALKAFHLQKAALARITGRHIDVIYGYGLK